MIKQTKILIVRLSAIGDVIHCLPALHALRRKFPNAYIGWVVEDKAADILINNPLLDKVYVLPKKKWKAQGLTINTIREFVHFVKLIREEKFDIAIDLQELFKSGLMTFLSGAKRRIGHAKTREFADIFLNEKLKPHNIFDPDKMIIERYLEPAQYLGAPTDEVKFNLPPINQETKDYIDSFLENFKEDRPLIVFSPATIWSSKHWIEAYWSELLEKLSLRYNIVLVGSKEDINLINRIMRSGSEQAERRLCRLGGGELIPVKSSNYLSLAGKTSLFQLIELFNRADILIAPDTGPAHIANATNKPVIITIFGSTSYKRTAPWGEQHEALSAELPCQPCFKRQCRRKDFKMECMKTITPDTIIKKINEKLATN